MLPILLWECSWVTYSRPMCRRPNSIKFAINSDQALIVFSCGTFVLYDNWNNQMGFMLDRHDDFNAESTWYCNPEYKLRFQHWCHVMISTLMPCYDFNIDAMLWFQHWCHVDFNNDAMLWFQHWCHVIISALNQCRCFNNKKDTFNSYS